MVDLVMANMSSRLPELSGRSLTVPLGQCLLPSARRSLLQLLPAVPPRPIHSLRNTRLVPQVLQPPQFLTHLLPSLADQLHTVVQHLVEDQCMLLPTKRIHQHLPKDRSKSCQLLPISTHKVGQLLPVSRFIVEQLLQLNHHPVGKPLPVNTFKLVQLHPTNHLKVGQCLPVNLYIVGQVFPLK
jgi:hypothetical protein